MINSLPIYHNYYFDENNQARNSGIYCPGINRWLLVDYYDSWVTFETAQVMSSKIASMVYLLPGNIEAMTNENCLSYSINTTSKQRQKKGNVADLISSQIPSLRIMMTQPEWVGPPTDFNFNHKDASVTALKEYAEYVRACLFASKITQATLAHTDMLDFSTAFLPTEWTDQVTLYSDNSDTPCGVLKEIKKILYFGKSLQDAKSQIHDLLERNYLDCSGLVSRFCKLMEETPEFLKP